MKYTNNYDLFSYLENNRTVNKDHVKKLVLSISQNNLLAANPVIVDREFNVIDGQHRIEACRILGISVPYLVVDCDYEAVIMLNTNQRNWTMLDYISSYINQGIKDYQILLDFSRQYKIPLSTSAVVLMDGMTSNGSFTSTIRNGEFRVKNIERSIYIMSIVESIKPFVEKNCLTDMQFYLAIIRTLKIKEVDSKSLVKKFSLMSKKLVRMSTLEMYLRSIEEVYNFRSHKKIRLF